MPLVGKFSGVEGLVGAGLDSIIIQDHRVVGFASGMSMDEDFELEGIRTLGFHGDRGFKSMGYTGSCSIDTYVLRDRDNPGALRTPGWQNDGTFNLNTAGEADFLIADVNTLTVLFTLLQAKLATQGIQFPARGMNVKSTTWRFTRAIPGINVS